jgi:molybdopterin/thiamine biosynthesis adenylyltransferase
MGLVSGSSHQHDEYFVRQRALNEIGPSGQRLLSSARVLSVGAGGLGCPVATYLASAGVGTLTICDGDHVDLTNIHRQVGYNLTDIGKPKASTLAKRLSGRAPGVEVRGIDRPFVRNDGLLADHDLVIECTDTFSAGFLVHDACYEAGVDLVVGSVHRFSAMIVRFDFATRRTGCLRCLWPTTPEDGSTGDSEQDGILGATAGVVGTWMAQEAVLHLVGSATARHGEQLLLDMLNRSTSTVAPAVNPDCPLCGEQNW